MIGRLVEQQQVGAAHQRLREIEPHPPAAGETPDQHRMARFGEAQAGEQRRCAGTCAVAAGRVKTMMKVGERFAAVVRVAIGGGECAFDRAQFAIAVQHVVERARCHRRGSCATCAIVHAEGRSIVPASGISSRQIAAKRLDLPHPLAPTGRACARRGPSGWRLQQALAPRARVRLVIRIRIRRGSKEEEVRK